MMITDKMLLDIAELEVEAHRVTMRFKNNRTQYIFTNGWDNANMIASEVSRRSLKMKLQNKKDEK